MNDQDQKQKDFEEKVEQIKALDNEIFIASQCKKASTVKTMIDRIKKIDTRTFGELQTEFTKKIDIVLTALNSIMQSQLSKEEVLTFAQKRVDENKVDPGNANSVSNKDEMMAEECYAALTQILNENDAGLVIEALLAGSIPHLEAGWVKS